MGVARNREPIKVISYVPLTPDGSVKMRTDEMTPEQRSYVGACLRTKMLNAVYGGQAVFYAEGLPPVETVFPQLARKQKIDT